MNAQRGDGYNTPIMSDKKVGRCGFKAYGSWLCFRSKRKFEDYLVKLMSCTSGSERDRAVDAFVALRRGVMFTDTD